MTDSREPAPRSLSVHLIDDLVGEKRPCRRAFLILLLLCGGSGLFYTMSRFLCDYTSNPYLVTTKIVQPSSYPPITFCPGFTADLQKLEAHGLTIEHYWDLMGFFWSNYDVMVFIQQLRQGKTNFTKSQKFSKEIDETLVKLNTSIKDLVLDLSIGVEDIWNSSAANIDGFGQNTTSLKPLFTGYGLCFCVDFGVQDLNEFTVSFSALHLAINQISWPGDAERGYFPRTDHLFVGERSKTMYPTPVYQIPRNGYRAAVHIYATHMQRQQGCVPETYDDHFKCLLSCLNAKCIAENMCTMDGADEYKDLTTNTCNMLRNRTCTVATDPRLAAECPKLCPPGCSEWIHDLSIFPLPTTKKELTFLSFSYASGLTTYSLEERYIYNWHGFLAGVGGQLSLWCGMSVLSVPQLLLYIWDFFLRKAGRRKITTKGVAPTK